MSITHGIEILNITPSNKEELRLALAAQRTNNPGEYYSWKNHEADSWIADFIFDKERRALNEVSFLDGEFFYYIIPKNVLKKWLKLLMRKTLEKIYMIMERFGRKFVTSLYLKLLNILLYGFRKT